RVLFRSISEKPCPGSAAATSRAPRDTAWHADAREYLRLLVKRPGRASWVGTSEIGQKVACRYSTNAGGAVVPALPPLAGETVRLTERNLTGPGSVSRRNCRIGLEGLGKIGRAHV